MSSSFNGEDVKARLRPFGILFEKSLRDLIKGIRANKEPEAQSKFLQNILNECRTEVKSSNMDMKTMAILKLCYLEMYGFDMSWANFHVLEVMSSNNFQQKRVGYLAAEQSFRKENDDVIMLATNLIKKDLNSASTHEVAVALSGVSMIMTRELAPDIVEDMVKMLNHSKPYIRKKTVLAFYKLYLKYPTALLTTFERVCDKLEDEDEAVVACTVTVICEMAKKSAKNFVQLAPKLYGILSNSTNNSVIIRLLKLFSSLTKIEPRLKVRLLPKILELLESSSALSLHYECINCIISGDMLRIENDGQNIVKLCFQHLNNFRMMDSNLRFLCLLSLNKMAKIFENDPDYEYEFNVFKNEMIEIPASILNRCYSDDLSEREQAYKLLQYCVTEKNCEASISPLFEDLNGKSHSKSVYLSDEFKIKIMNHMLDLLTSKNYERIQNFDWFVETIMSLTVFAADNGLYDVGYRLGIEIRNILVKIPSIRTSVINDFLLSSVICNVSVGKNLVNCLKEIMWAVGEYSDAIDNCNTLLLNLIERFSSKNRDDFLNNDDNEKAEHDYDNLITILIPCVVKMFNSSCQKLGYWDYSIVMAQVESIIEFLSGFTTSKNFNIQERSVQLLDFFNLIKDSIKQNENTESVPLLITEVLPSFFNSWEITPIPYNFQKKIAAPAGLDLDTEIYPLDSEYSGEDAYLNFRTAKELVLYSGSESESEEEFEEYSNPLLAQESETDLFLEDSDHDSKEMVERRRLERFETQKNDPYYLSDNVPVSQTSIQSEEEEVIEKEPKRERKIKIKPVVLTEESIIGDVDIIADVNENSQKSKKKSLFKVDDAGLADFDLSGDHAEFAGSAVPVSSGIVEYEPRTEELVVVAKKKKHKKKHGKKHKKKSEEA